MIEIRDLRKSFADKQVLQGVDLEIASGQTTTIIGGSGSGKSVLFKHVIGLMKPDAGSILVDGEDITQMGESDLYRMVEKFGLVFQSGALFDSMTVGKNVAFGIKKQKGVTPAELDAIIEHSLTQVGLSDISRILPGGTQRRHEKAGGHRPGHCQEASDHHVRRAHHRPGPDHGRHHQ